MNAYEDFEDLITSNTKVDWEQVKGNLQNMCTHELMELIEELGLYVNKRIALEIAKRDDSVFFLRKALQDGRYWHSYGEGERWSPIHAIHMLVLIKTDEALDMLLDVIRYKNEELNDWLTEEMPKLLAAFGENAIEKLKKFTHDETLESHGRAAAGTALVVLGKRFPACKEDIKQHLIRLIENADDFVFTNKIADDIATFYDKSLMPVMEKAFEDDRIESIVAIKETIDGKYVEMDENAYKAFTEDPLEHFSRETILYFHNRSKDKRAYDISEYDTPEYDKNNVSEKIKIGRNDPCPCGSGKKYKKCCLSII